MSQKCAFVSFGFIFRFASPFDLIELLLFIFNCDCNLLR